MQEIQQQVKDNIDWILKNESIYNAFNGGNCFEIEIENELYEICLSSARDRENNFYIEFDLVQDDEILESDYTYAITKAELIEDITNFISEVLKNE